MKIHHYPTIDGVEFRTFGVGPDGKPEHYRLIDAVFERRETSPADGHEDRASFASLMTGQMFLRDREQGGILIPRVCGFDITDYLGGGMLAGRLRRMATDVVQTEGNDFHQGYMFMSGDMASRVVSEPYILSQILVLDPEAFATARIAAEEAARKLTPDIGPSTAWGSCQLHKRP
jgi:hypothetical protein